MHICGTNDLDPGLISTFMFSTGVFCLLSVISGVKVDGKKLNLILYTNDIKLSIF